MVVQCISLIIICENVEIDTVCTTHARFNHHLGEWVPVAYEYVPRKLIGFPSALIEVAQ